MFSISIQSHLWNPKSQITSTHLFVRHPHNRLIRRIQAGSVLEPCSLFKHHASWGVWTQTKGQTEHERYPAGGLTSDRTPFSQPLLPLIGRWQMQRAYVRRAQGSQSGSSYAVDVDCPSMEMPSGQGYCSRVSSPVARLFQKGDVRCRPECFLGESQFRRSLDCEHEGTIRERN